MQGMEGKNRLNRNPIGFNIMAYGIVGFMALMGVLPFWLLVMGSVTDQGYIIREGFSLWPSQFSLDAYRMAFQVPHIILRSYAVSIFITATGTLGTIVFCSMAGYSLSRSDFYYRNYFAFFFYFPALFSGGLIPFFIWMNTIGMVDNILVLILPGMMTFWFIVILRSFFKGLPEEIGESGKIDGANEVTICFKLYMPMAVPALATVGLFSALGYWNAWMNAMLFIRDPRLFPLQFQLHRILNNARVAAQAAQEAGIPSAEVPTFAFQLAMVCIAIGPMFMLFPYIQRYFIKGLTIGAVKG